MATFPHKSVPCEERDLYIVNTKPQEMFYRIDHILFILLENKNWFYKWKSETHFEDIHINYKANYFLSVPTTTWVICWSSQQGVPGRHTDRWSEVFLSVLTTAATEIRCFTKCMVVSLQHSDRQPERQTEGQMTEMWPRSSKWHKNWYFSFMSIVLWLILTALNNFDTVYRL